ncbi:MAG: hypothetical protein GY861_22585 [bacterium]|nr:hypothetical protein [bacterium]
MRKDVTKEIEKLADMRDEYGPDSTLQWKTCDDQIRKILRKRFGQEKVVCILSKNVPDVDVSNIEEYLYDKHILEDRWKLEYNPKYLQIIPYTTIITENGSIFTTIRQINEGDPRLLGAISIGTGGHIDGIDLLAEKNFIKQSIRRELEEEVYIEFDPKRLFYMGQFVDNSNRVGKDHLCLHFTYKVKSKKDITIKTKSGELVGFFTEPWELLANVGKLENWSKIALYSM